MSGPSELPACAAKVAPQQTLQVPCASIETLPGLGDTVTSLPQSLEVSLDAAFGADGPGVICIVGDDAFREQVRRIRAELLPLALALNRLPEASKDTIRERGTLNVSNFSEGVDGNRSGLYFHPTTDTPGDSLPEGIVPEPTFYTPNLWPDEDLPSLRVQAREAAPFLVDVGRRLAAAVDQRFAEVVPGYRPGTLSKLVGEPASCNHKCRLICYREYDSETQRSACKGMWAPPHKDTGLLTALVPGVFLDATSGERLEAGCPDPEVGLYVRDRKGAITQIVAPLGDCLFFQVGEALQIVSGGQYHATEHCVRGPPRARAGYVRASLAVFFQPHAHEELPLPAGTSLKDVAEKAYDGLFRMFLLYQPPDAKGMNFLQFCQREGF
ncbi:unnamed protein product [Polarella glacialis]|uniref:Isopenicillin N synthase-like Fe(2+) 2OG dioxygenase domain-containing protein n=1 Tax=Polarella glacialis TaxID=89957 RepID=A0A813LI75_POLGL|nr:unnamed protein product [Polarella glacialis]